MALKVSCLQWVENNDRDHDGLTDAEETSHGTELDNPDSDGDGLTDGEEVSRGTKPLVQDSDGDGYSDYIEVQAGSDPLDDQSAPLADISVEKSVADSNIDVGDNVTFTIAVLNQGTKRCYRYRGHGPDA